MLELFPNLLTLNSNVPGPILNLKCTFFFIVLQLLMSFILHIYFLIFNIYLCVRKRGEGRREIKRVDACVMVYIYMEVRGQLIGAGSFLLLCSFTLWIEF